VTAHRTENSQKTFFASLVKIGHCVLHFSLARAMVAMMAGQDTIEELTPADLGDLRECIEQRLVFSDRPRLE
jgi:hypothetical protein